MAHSTQSSLKHDVTQQLIRALEELEGRPRQRTQHALAEKAIRSLSFDFPVGMSGPRHTANDISTMGGCWPVVFVGTWEVAAPHRAARALIFTYGYINTSVCVQLVNEVELLALADTLR